MPLLQFNDLDVLGVCEMSALEVQRFLNQLSQDRSLQVQIIEVMQSEDDRKAVVGLARSQGFAITEAELVQEIETRQAALYQQIGREELSDDELENVAGGNYDLNAIASAKLLVAQHSLIAHAIAKEVRLKW